MPGSAKRVCDFCSVETLRARNRLIYEDARVIAIRDRNPRATAHLLVISREHIPSVKDLAPEHLDLLRHMVGTGKRLLADDGYPEDSADTRFGFHRPPFASVPHLHLHCLGAPFVPHWNRLRFSETPLRSYVSAESVLATLVRRA